MLTSYSSRDGTLGGKNLILTSVASVEIYQVLEHEQAVPVRSILFEQSR